MQPRKGRVVESRYLSGNAAAKKENSSSLDRKLSIEKPKANVRTSIQPLAERRSGPFNLKKRESTASLVTQRQSTSNSTVPQRQPVISIQPRQAPVAAKETKYDQVHSLYTRILQVKLLATRAQKAFESREKQSTNALSVLWSQIQQERQQLAALMEEFELQKTRAQILSDVNEQIEIIEPEVEAWREFEFAYREMAQAVEDVMQKMKLESIKVNQGTFVSFILSDIKSSLLDAISIGFPSTETMQGFFSCKEEMEQLCSLMQQEKQLIDECTQMMQELEVMESAEKSAAVHLIELNDSYFKMPLTSV